MAARRGLRLIVLPAIGLLVTGLLVGAAVPAAPPGTSAEAAAPEQLERARARESQLQAANVEAARQLRETETALSEAAQQVAELADRQRRAELALGQRAEAVAPLLPLAQRLSLFPAETMLAVPTSPERALAGLAILHGLARTIEDQAAGLRDELAAVQQARRGLAEAQARLQADEAEQARRAAKLDADLAVARVDRSHLEDAAAEQARRAAAEATRADTVEGALQSMDASRARTELELQQDADRAERQRHDSALETARRRQAQVAAAAGPGLVSGGGVIPVAGPVIRRWGDETDAGPAHGMVFRAPPKGRVVSPCQGRVVFGAPFRSYGVLVIVDCGKGSHVVLSGFDHLDVEAGDAVAAGQPLGVMPDYNPAGGATPPSLYVEFRRAGRPVDPAPFLRAPS